MTIADSWNTCDASNLVATRAANSFTKQRNRLVGQLQTLDRREKTALKQHDRKGSPGRTARGLPLDSGFKAVGDSAESKGVIADRFGRTLLNPREVYPALPH